MKSKNGKICILFLLYVWAVLIHHRYYEYFESSKNDEVTKISKTADAATTATTTTASETTTNMASVKEHLAYDGIGERDYLRGGPMLEEKYGQKRMNSQQQYHYGKHDESNFTGAQHWHNWIQRLSSKFNAHTNINLEEEAEVKEQNGEDELMRIMKWEGVSVEELLDVSPWITPELSWEIIKSDDDSLNDDGDETEEDVMQSLELPSENFNSTELDDRDSLLPLEMGTMEVPPDINPIDGSILNQGFARDYIHCQSTISGAIDEEHEEFIHQNHLHQETITKPKTFLQVVILHPPERIDWDPSPLLRHICKNIHKHIHHNNKNDNSYDDNSHPNYNNIDNDNDNILSSNPLDNTLSISITALNPHGYSNQYALDGHTLKRILLALEHGGTPNILNNNHVIIRSNLRGSFTANPSHSSSSAALANPFTYNTNYHPNHADERIRIIVTPGRTYHALLDMKHNTHQNMYEAWIAVHIPSIESSTNLDSQTILQNVPQNVWNTFKQTSTPILSVHLENDAAGRAATQHLVDSVGAMAISMEETYIPQHDNDETFTYTDVDSYSKTSQEYLHHTFPLDYIEEFDNMFWNFVNKRLLHPIET